MNFYIQELPDHTAALINLQGQQLLTFNSLDAALTASRDLEPHAENRVIPCTDIAPLNRPAYFDSTGSGER